jgi:AraC-like DNA-binding protein
MRGNMVADQCLTGRKSPNPGIDPVNKRLDRNPNWVLLAKRARYKAKDLAGLVQVSLRQLERHFGDYFGRTPQDWLDELRLIRAALLLTGGVRPKEAARQLDFHDGAHFCRSFKRYHGCTPTRFVQIHDQRIERRKKQFESWCPGEKVPPEWLVDPVLTKPWEILLQLPRQRVTSSPRRD